MLNFRWPRIILRMLYEAVFVALILYSFIILFLHEIPGFFVIASLLLLYVLSFGIREWISTHMGILFIHLGLMGVLFVLPFPGRQGLVLIGLQVYLTISALNYSRKGAVIKPISDVPWPSFLVCCFIYILSLVSHQSFLMKITYIVTILLLLIYYLMLYVEGLTKYMDTTKDVSGLPLKRMVQTNTRIVSIIILVLVLGLFMGYIFGTDEITDALLAVCRTIVQYLFGIIWFILNKLGELFGERYMDWDYIEGDFASPEKVTGWGLVLEILLMAVFIGAMVFLFYRLLRKLIKLLLKPRSYEEDIIETAEKEKTVTKEKSHGRINFPRPLTLEEKARRYYKLRIMKHKDEISLNSQSTCRDIENEVRQKGFDDVSEMTEFYSQIRYGAEGTNKKMLKRMKELAGK